VDEKFLREADQQLTGWSDPLARLQSALDKDELTLFCQPIRALQGAPGYPMAEVLVRLREEESALLPPGEFLPIFEHYRMMPQLDRWVVRSTARRLASGSKVPRFTINVSGQTLDDQDFPMYVRDEIRNAGILAASLMFEIDEPDALSSPESAARFAGDMKAVGCGLLIDGFGRRAASFAPLKTLRVDFLKVDGSLTRRILASDIASNKLKAMVRVGEATGIGLVAECIEEQDVLLRVKALGVGYAQGFGIHRPVAIDSVAAG
jgi:EAL domain-containing protein (putative c-di-GMP-specific phosphodiesterase class I)